MKNIVGLCLPFLLLATACGVTAKAPPVELSFRDSLLGAGKIVQITNTSSEPLEQVRVLFRSPSGEERTFDQATLGANQSFEVGWKKLESWQIVEGTEVDVTCKGHLRAISGKVE